MNRRKQLRVTTKGRSKTFRESQGRYRTLFDLAPVAVYSCDASGVIRDYNNRAGELWGREPVPGDTDERFCGSFKMYRPDGSFMPHEQCPMGDVLSGQVAGVHDGEVHIERPDGSRVIVIVNIAPLTDNRGKITGAINCFYDITERKQAEESRRQSEARLQTFSNQLERVVQERTDELVQSQDRLRVLAIELSLAEQRERQRLAGELHDYLAQLLVVCRLNLGQIRRVGLVPKADDMIKDTEEVLNQALTYSRTLMAELSPPVLREHGLPAGLKWLGEQMQHRGLAVTFEGDASSDVPLSDDCAVLLFQSVRELLMNALKHAESRAVTVALDQSHGRLRIEVRDDGIGFDPIGADTNPSTALSSRFGLFSIRERMRALGGSFHLQSAPGEGTTATLVLPLKGLCERVTPSKITSPEAHAAETIHRIPSPSSAVTPLSVHQSNAIIRILLVDDHAMVREGLRSVLESYPDVVVVGEAQDGEEAVAFVERLRPTIVVMDINMPTMNGIDATDVIRSRYPGTIVIGLSVQAGGANQEAMRNAGAVRLLTKEAAVDELYRAIRETLDIRRTTSLNS